MIVKIGLWLLVVLVCAIVDTLAKRALSIDMDAPSRPHAIAYDVVQTCCAIVMWEAFQPTLAVILGD